MLWNQLFKGSAVAVCLLAGLASSALHSPVAVAEQVQSETSTQAANLRALLNRIETLSGRFEQHIYENGEQVEVIQGAFALKRPSQLFWQTETPDESVLVADGETVWYYNPFIEQVSLFTQAQTMASNPLLVLLESDDWQGFSIQHKDGRWFIDGEGDSEGQQLVLNFNNTGQLMQMELIDAYGQRSIFYLSNTQENQAIAAERFQFIVPDGVDIDDQRVL